MSDAIDTSGDVTVAATGTVGASPLAPTADGSPVASASTQDPSLAGLATTVASASDAPSGVSETPNAPAPVEAPVAETSAVETSSSETTDPTVEDPGHQHPVGATGLTDAHEAHGQRLHEALSHVLKVIEEGGVLSEEFIGKEYDEAKDWILNAISFVEKKL